ncbi:MAG: hypothetical protein ACRD08_15505, partial [Acidimicrobiales bacterium]
MILALLVPLAAFAQDTAAAPPGHRALNLTIAGTGISIGNSARVNGMRLNFRDYGLERVNGVNVTIWQPKEPLSGTVTGLAVGLVGPGADSFNGIAIGVGGVVADERARWISLGGLGVVSQGTLEGIVIGGLGVVSQGTVDGVGVGGLGLVSQGTMRGLVIGGLGTVANGGVSGFAIGGLGTVANAHISGVAIGGLAAVTNGTLRGAGVGGLALVANGSIHGAGLSGLAVVTNGNLRGVGVGGLALVANGDLRGMGVGGLAVVAGRSITGLSTALLRVDSPRITGLNVAGSYLRTTDLSGFSASAYTRVRGTQVGLSDRPVQLSACAQGSADRSTQPGAEQQGTVQGAAVGERALVTSAISYQLSAIRHLCGSSRGRPP